MEIKNKTDIAFVCNQLSKPQTFNQEEFNDLVRDLNLSKEASEVIASRLKEKYWLIVGSKITSYRNREEAFLPYFYSDIDLIYYNYIGELLLKISYNNTNQQYVYNNTNQMIGVFL